MLKKLLKYDFRSVMKYWWIVAVTSLALSFMGGGCLSVLSSERDLPTILYPFITFAMAFVIIGLTILYFGTVVVIFIRFYKNFFTDEGYLTFTLPVTKAKLINSKLIMSVSILLITFFLYLLELLIILVIGHSDVVFTADFWNGFREFRNLVWDTLGGYTIVYLVELLIICVLLFTFSILFMFCCITFASIITKKAKVLAAIGIYYGANSLFSLVVQIFYLFGLSHLIDQMSYLSQQTIIPTIALVLLGIICFVFILCVMLYTLLYWMIDRKLNLS